MTNATWAKCTPYLIKGYRNFPIIKDVPEWEMIEFLDGFLSYERVVSASVARRNNRIVSIKEESNTSHCNQAFDQAVAKNDKKLLQKPSQNNVPFSSSAIVLQLLNGILF